MNIVFLMTQSLESPGGGGRYWPLAKALQNLGHSVCILTTHHDFHNLTQKQFVKEGVKIHYIGQMHVQKRGNHKTYYPVWKLLWIALNSTLLLTWHGLQSSADIIQVCKTQPMNIIAARVISWLKKTPVFVDSDDYEAENNRFTAHWQQKIVAIFEDVIIKFASGITAGNSFIANRFIKLGYPSTQLRVVHNGVERTRFMDNSSKDIEAEKAQLRQELGIRPFQKAIVYVGSLSLTSHAIDMLLHAFAQVHYILSDVELVIVGAGEDMAYLQEMAVTLGIARNTQFVGRVPSELIPHYFHLGDVSIDPMRNTVQAESSVSLKLLESIASGTPCITADIGDRKQIVASAGIAVQPDDEKALAKAIVDLLQHSHELLFMANQAKIVRENHWWDVKVTQFEKLYGNQCDY